MKELEAWGRRKLEELKGDLALLKQRHLSEATLGSKKEPVKVKGNFNRVDLSGATGHVLIVSDFTNLVDASNAQGLVLILEGNFNIVDSSGGKIKIHKEEAEINIEDPSGSEEVQLEDIDIPEE